MKEFLVKFFDEESTSLKELEILSFTENGIDLISDESFTITTRNQVDLNIGDLLVVSYNLIDSYYFIDKIIDNSEITFKSLLEVFNHNVYLEDFNIGLRDFLNLNFVNPLLDVQRTINWLNIDDISNDIIAYVQKETSVSDTDVVIVNAKEIFINTLLKYHNTLTFINDLNNGKIKIKTEPNQTIKEINLNVIGLLNIELPKLSNQINTLDILKIESEEFEFTDDESNTQTGKREISREILTYVLTDDNQISTDINISNRLLPPQTDVTISSFLTTEIPDFDDIAEDKLIDDSKYYASFEILNSSQTYHANDYNLGDIIDLFYNGQRFRSILTAKIFKENTVEYKFGRNRIDLIFKIKENNG